jgi:hypothetical protein
MAAFHERKQLKVPGLEVSLVFLLLLIVLASFEDKQLSPGEWWLIGGTVVFSILFWIFMRSMVLEITIDDTGIRFRYPPVVRKERQISWDSISHVSWSDINR